MKNKDKIKQDFNLNIDSQKEFEKINGKMELVDDSICLMGKFSKLKKSMILTCSVLGALLVGSVGYYVIDDICFDRFKLLQSRLFSNSLIVANEYFETHDIYDNTCLLTHFINNEILMNIYDINKTFIGQVFSSDAMIGWALVYNLENSDKTISLNEKNTIWEFGEIKDKTIDISFYKNNQIIDNFSFKI